MRKPLQSTPNLMQAIQDALALHRQGRLDEADKIYGRVLKAIPDQFDALHLGAMLKLQLGRAGEAFRLITAALKVEPRSADALSNLGLVLKALKRDADALASFDKALALVPDHVEALNNRGRALAELARPEEALACFDRVLSLQPRHVEALINRGNALCDLRRLDAALADYDAALAASPDHPGAHFNRGNALASLARHTDAVAAYDRALAQAPAYVKALNNRGIALAALNRKHEALESYAKAITVDGSDADAHFNEALALLAIGDFARGLEQYEWRWRRTGMAPWRRSFGRPLWLGEYPLGRRTILIHAEQGLGDAIQFARYVPLLARTGAGVVLEVQPELTSLLSRLDGVSAVVARGDKLPAFDVHCPVASLPLALGTTPATIPAAVPYLAAEAEHLATWRSRLQPIRPPRIAIAWAGRPTHPNDRNRSVTLAELDPVLSTPDVAFVGVQRDLPDGDFERIRGEPRITHIGDELADFSDTAAVVALADLVVSVDTSIVHLAGAMGRPTWILLPFAPDWRWQLDRDDSPWYPTARLFRQATAGDWSGVMARVRTELAKIGGSRHG
jgi:tetratricopeptide (TPR) repeat protein